MVLLLLGCTSDPAPAHSGAVEARPDIFLITTDATHSAYLGSEAAQSTTPNLDQLFAESVVLPNTLTVRGLTVIAIVAFGSDHGEELARRDDQPYFYHGCSPYNDVMRVTWSIRAPGLAPTGLEAWVSSTDMAPTLLDLAGVPWKGREAEGRSLVPLLRQESTETVPVYAERGTSTAMVIHKGFKYLLNPEGGFTGCNPYEADGSSYQAPRRALWELSTDPGELQNLSGQGHQEEAELRQLLCARVSTPGWTDGGGPTTVLQDDCSGG